MINFAAEMNKLHIFNPEHDIALASNLSNFTAPHAGRQLRADLGFLPAVWAAKGDYVWVENADYAARAWRRSMRGRKCPVEWVTRQQLASPHQRCFRMGVGCSIAPVVVASWCQRTASAVNAGGS